ncbi:MAG: hypothetical protein HZA14_03145 [Nitrospirae bacterium]|nr:hypothetical protein [Nitrospirota bacterium]
MAVDGLGNIFGIPVVKKDQESGKIKQKNQKKDRKGERREEKEEEEKEKEGRIDIRV